MSDPAAVAGTRTLRNPAEKGVWNGSCRLFRVLWVSRVSVVSLLAGFLLMWKVPQAQDMLAEYNPVWWYWPLFFLAVAFGWAFPVHFASRWILGSGLRVLEPNALPYMDAAEEVRVLALYQTFVTWVPRILGLASFAAVALGIHEAERNLSSAAGFPPADRALDQLDWLARANLVVALLFAAFLLFRRDVVRLVRTGRWHGDGSGEIRPSWEKRGWDTDLRMALAYVAILFLAWLGAVLFPVDFVTWLYRAAFFPVMLGFPVFALTWVAYGSHVTRAPLILILALVCAGISWLSVHAHDLRVLRADSAAAQPARQVRLDQAIAAWRRHNGCPTGPCPSPIIVTGQGGASRAAFFTAAVVGDLLDRSARDGDRPQFAKQLFALSTVSGSSLGAVAIRAAMADAGYGRPGAPSGPPCSRSSALWHGRHPAAEGGVEPPARDPRVKWRDCLELLVAGDYLSPSFVGLFFRDVVSIPWIGRPLWPDRAAILEDSWEKHYRRTVGKASDGEAKPRGLASPLGYHPSKADGDTGWVPLLFLNGSSVGGGRRILASDVLPWNCPDSRTDIDPAALYSEAFDLFELLGAESDQLAYRRSCAGAPVQPAAPDIALSTGATTSARFPILSPPGTIRRKSGDIVEHVIDGGYFDNEGLTTARDIAAALRRNGLVPVVLRLTNEPASAPLPPDPSAGTPVGTPIPRPRLPDDAAGGFLISFISPLTGLINTRTGHGSEAARSAIDCVDDRTGPSEYMHVAVFPRAPQATADPAAKAPAEAFMNEISMSWWLSQPVQAYLERQMADPRNGPAFETLAALLGRTVEGTASGCHG